MERPDASLIRPIALRRHRLPTNLVLAPMAGVSNLPMRLISREYGAAMGFTETVSARGLVLGGHKSRRLLETSPQEDPVAFQLFGAEPDVLGRACALLEDEGATWIDLNLGCPVPKFIRNGAGSALMREPLRAAAVIRAMRRSFGGTLSVKMRAGWDERSRNAPEIARIAAAEGAELVTVHGRTRSQFYRGRADPEIIRAVVEAVPDLPVLANGDVTEPEHATDLLRKTGAAGVMIGRGATGNPWIFRAILERARGGTFPEPTAEERFRVLERHTSLLRRTFPDDVQLARNLKKYLAAYSRGMPGAALFRTQVNESDDLGRILRLTREFFDPGRSPTREAA